MRELNRAMGKDVNVYVQQEDCDYIKFFFLSFLSLFSSLLSFTLFFCIICYFLTLCQSPIPFFSRRQHYGYMLGNNGQPETGGGMPHLRLCQISPLVPFAIRDEVFTPFLVMHGERQILGYAFRDVVYITDGSALPPTTRTFLEVRRPRIVSSFSFIHAFVCFFPSFFFVMSVAFAITAKR